MITASLEDANTVPQRPIGGSDSGTADKAAPATHSSSIGNKSSWLQSPHHCINISRSDPIQLIRSPNNKLKR